MKAREVKRARLVQKYAERKAALRLQAKELAKQGESAYEIYQQLQRLPKNASSIRMHNRCSITGRPKGRTGAYSPWDVR